jgi:hypothetical protein
MEKKTNTNPLDEPIRTPAAEKPSRAALSRHRRKCTVCQHPDRQFIEQEFLHWHSTPNIARFYNITERAIYRHAHALNLYQPRNRKLRFSLSHMLEHASQVRVTADSIVQAVRAFTHLTDDGQWISTPKPRSAQASIQKEVRQQVRSLVQSEAEEIARSAARTASEAASSPANSDFLIVSPRREKHAATA